MLFRYLAQSLGYQWVKRARLSLCNGSIYWESLCITTCAVFAQP